jgi:hypothetical protein
MPSQMTNSTQLKANNRMGEANAVVHQYIKRSATAMDACGMTVMTITSANTINRLTMASGISRRPCLLYA